MIDSLVEGFWCMPSALSAHTLLATSPDRLVLLPGPTDGRVPKLVVYDLFFLGRWTGQNSTQFFKRSTPFLITPLPPYPMFGRLAALIGRLTQSTFGDERSRLRIDLDGPHLGDPRQPT